MAPKAEKKPVEKKPVGRVSSREIEQEADDHVEGDPDRREIGRARWIGEARCIGGDWRLY